MLCIRFLCSFVKAIDLFIWLIVERKWRHYYIIHSASVLILEFPRSFSGEIYIIQFAVPTAKMHSMDQFVEDKRKTIFYGVSAFSYSSIFMCIWTVFNSGSVIHFILVAFYRMMKLACKQIEFSICPQFEICLSFSSFSHTNTMYWLFHFKWLAYFDFKCIRYFQLVANMQGIRNSILSHVRLRTFAQQQLLTQRKNVFKQLHQQMCALSGSSPDQIMDRVIGLVKKFDNIDAAMVINAWLPSDIFCVYICVCVHFMMVWIGRLPFLFF